MKNAKRFSIGILLLLIFVLSLNAITIFGSLSDASGYSHSSKAKWEKMPGKAKDIAIGINNIFHVSKEDDVNGNNVNVWNYYDDKWNSIPGNLARITAGEKLWGFNDKGDIWKLIAFKVWQPISTEGLPKGRLTDIAIGGRPPREKLYVIGPSQRRQGGQTYLYSRINGRWQWEKYDDELVTRITVNGYGYPWAINEYTGKIYRGDRIGWKERPGKAWYDIAAATSDVFMLGYYRHWKYGSMVYRSTDFTHWSRVSPLCLATNIDVAEVNDEGRVWVVNGQGTIYRLIRNYKS